MAASRTASRSPRDIANVMQRLQGKGQSGRDRFCIFKYTLKFKYQLHSGSFQFACTLFPFQETARNQKVMSLFLAFSDQSLLFPGAVFFMLQKDKDRALCLAWRLHQCDLDGQSVASWEFSDGQTALQSPRMIPHCDHAQGYDDGDRDCTLWSNKSTSSLLIPTRKLYEIQKVFKENEAMRPRGFMT